MKAKYFLIALSITVLVLGAFFLGQLSQKKTAPIKKAKVKKSAAARQAEKKVIAPIVVGAKSPRVVRVAIVIDDFGYNTNNLSAFFDINEPLTFSILPNLRHSAEVAEKAVQHGCEVILHLPMEAHRKGVTEEPGTLKVGEDRKQVLAQLEKDISSVPGLVGVSNHMGSKATEDRELMTTVLSYLKERGLFFFDSLTSEKSVGGDVAKELGLRFAKRDIFLDNSDNVDSILTELGDLKKLALRRGRAIAICHDRKNTATALAKAMPEMAKEGIRFVHLSEMVK